jgi:hypothetical protein
VHLNFWTTTKKSTPTSVHLAKISFKNEETMNRFSYNRIRICYQQICSIWMVKKFSYF